MTTPRPDHDDLRAEHTVDAIRRRIEDGPAHSYLRDFVYGAIDGAETLAIGGAAAVLAFAVGTFLKRVAGG